MKVRALLVERLTEAETGTYNGLKVFGPRPNEEALRKRLGKDFSQARKALHLVTGFGRKGEYRYYVEAWAVPAGSGMLTIYSLRSDGRIGGSWVPVPADKVVLL